jgi:hypothetical protein
MLILFITLAVLLAGTNIPARGAVYSDITGHWAEQDICKMNAMGIIKGDGYGIFYPEEFTSRQEAVSLMVGLVGKQAMAPEMGARSSASAPGLSDWAKGYILCARQEGIITDSELQSLNWSGAAQRQEVAVWLSKAVKLQPVVDTTVLNRFADKDNINQLKAPTIVPLVQDNILVGRDGCFYPQQPIKRCEVASLLSRAEDRYMSAVISRSQRGQVVSFGGWPNQSVTVRSSMGQQLSLNVNNQTGLFKNRLRATVTALAVGDSIEYITDGYSGLLYAEVASGSGYSTYYRGSSSSNPQEYYGYDTVEGEVYNINWSSGILDLMVDGDWKRYYMDAALLNQYREYDDEDSFYKGDEVELSLSGGRIISIDVLDEDDGDDDDNDGDIIVYKATLSNVNENSDEITLKSGTVYEWDGSGWDDVSGSKNLDTDDDTDIYYNSNDLDMDDLERYEGNKVLVAYDNDEDTVVKIRVMKGTEYKYSDSISDLDTSDEEFELEDENRTFEYDDSTIFICDGELGSEDDLDEDDDISIVADRSGSTYYAALVELEDTDNDDDDDDDRDGDNYRVYTGKLEDVNDDDYEIDLDDDSMQYLSGSSWRNYSGDNTFELDEDVDIYFDRSSRDVDELDEYEGYTVYMAYDEDDDVVDILRIIKWKGSFAVREIEDIDDGEQPGN